MTPKERIANWKIHPSIRGEFAFELYKHMAENEKIVLLTGDLGYGMFDAIKADFPYRFFNVGAAEQAMVAIAVGMSYEGKIPFVYSITNFMLYKPYEVIKNYVNIEQANVKLCGGGRDKDYAHDGISHDATDAAHVLTTLPDIKVLWPTERKDVATFVKEMVDTTGPYFISLKK